MLSKATVIGAGAMGTIAAQILAGNGVRVALWGRDAMRVQQMMVLRENARYLPGLKLSSNILPTTDAPLALRHSELVVSAVPAQYTRAVWEQLGPMLPAGVPICSTAKGIEIETLALPSQLIDQFVGENPIAVLSGPSIAPEMARCLPTTVVVASRNPEIADLVQSAMSTSWFRVYTNPDLLGVELAGALKNVIAIAAGILDGLKAGDNAKAALLTRGLVEITRFGVALGARSETFVGLAGLGDLVTTCVSPLGRNRTAGELIGQGRSVDEVLAGSPSAIEGIPTTRALLKLATRHGIEMPITEAVGDVLFNGEPPLSAITKLMNRPLKAETQ